MGLNFENIEGQTPLDEDEKEGLLLKTISTRGELDEFEQANIQDAIEWSMKSKISREQLLSEDFILLIHKRCLVQYGTGLGPREKQTRILE